MSFPITSFKEQIKWVLRAVIYFSVRRVRLAWTHIFEGCNCCIVRLRGCNSPVSGNIARLFVVKARLPEAYVTFIAGVTLLDHLLWKHRSLESCVHLSTFQVDVLYVWLETHGLQIQNTFWNKHTNSDYHLKASGWQNSVLRRIACISSIDERKMAWSFVVESLLVRSFSIKNDCIWLCRMFFSLSPPKIDSLSLKSWGWHLLPSLMAWHRHMQ